MLPSVRLSDGTDITLRLLGPRDRDAFLAFTSRCPSTTCCSCARTSRTRTSSTTGSITSTLERIITIVAERDGRIFGYGSLHLSNAPWSQHVGELRVLINGEMRGKGLGRALTDAMFAQALDRGIEKMVAQMTIDQKGAIATFEELGFQPEALLRDHVKDRAARSTTCSCTRTTCRVPVAARRLRRQRSRRRRQRRARCYTPVMGTFTAHLTLRGPSENGTPGQSVTVEALSIPARCSAPRPLSSSSN